MTTYIKTRIAAKRPTPSPKYWRTSGIGLVLVVSMTVLLLLTGIQGTCESEVLGNSPKSSLNSSPKRSNAGSICQFDSQRRLDTIIFWHALGNAFPIDINEKSVVKGELVFDMHKWNISKHQLSSKRLDDTIRYSKLLLDMTKKDPKTKKEPSYKHYILDDVLKVLQVISHFSIGYLEVKTDLINDASTGYLLPTEIPMYYEDDLRLLVADRLPVDIQHFILHEADTYIVYVITSVFTPDSTNASLSIDWNTTLHLSTSINRAFLLQLCIVKIYHTGLFEINLQIFCALPNLQHVTLDSLHGSESYSLSYIVVPRPFMVSVPMEKLLSTAPITSYDKRSNSPLHAGYEALRNMSLKEFLWLKVFNKAASQSNQNGKQKIPDVRAMVNSINASDIIPHIYLADACDQSLRLVDVLRECASEYFTEDMLKIVEETPELNILFKDAFNSGLKASNMKASIKAGVVYFELDLNLTVSELLFAIANQPLKSLKTLTMHCSGLPSLLTCLQKCSTLFTVDAIDVVGITNVSDLSQINENIAHLNPSMHNTPSSYITPLDVLSTAITILVDTRKAFLAPIKYWMDEILVYLQCQAYLVRLLQTTISILTKDTDKSKWISDTKVCEWDLSTQKAADLPSNTSLGLWTAKNDKPFQKYQEYTHVAIKTFENTPEEINKLVPVIPVSLYAALVRGTVKDKIHSDYADMPFLNKDYSGVSQETFLCKGCKKCADLGNSGTKPKASNPIFATFDPTLQYIAMLCIHHPLCFKCAYPIIAECEESKRKCPVCVAESSMALTTSNNAISALSGNLVLGVLIQLYDGSYAVDVSCSNLAEEIKQNSSTIPYWLLCSSEIIDKIISTYVAVMRPPPARPGFINSTASFIHKRFTISVKSTPSTSNRECE